MCKCNHIDVNIKLNEIYQPAFQPRTSKLLLFATLRCGILPLGIETGRYHKIRLGEHTCELCQTNEIEDEIHFICRCNFLNVKHTALFNSISETFDEFIHFNDTGNFIFLMKHRQRQLSKFTLEAYCL